MPNIKIENYILLYFFHKHYFAEKLEWPNDKNMKKDIKNHFLSSAATDTNTGKKSYFF